MGFFHTLGTLAGYLVFRGMTRYADSPKAVTRHGSQLDAQIQAETGLKPVTDAFLGASAPHIAVAQRDTVERACTCLSALYQAIDWQPVSTPLWQAYGVARDYPSNGFTYPVFTNKPIKAGYTDNTGALDLIADTFQPACINPGTVIAQALGHIQVALQSVRDSYPVRCPQRARMNGIWIGDKDNYIVERTESGKQWFDQVQARILELSTVAMKAAYNAYAARNGLDLLPEVLHQYGYMTRSEYAAAASKLK